MIPPRAAGDEGTSALPVSTASGAAINEDRVDDGGLWLGTDAGMEPRVRNGRSGESSSVRSLAQKLPSLPTESAKDSPRPSFVDSAFGDGTVPPNLGEDQRGDGMPSGEG